jgi:ribosomal protein S18 acetylase RimI-like enzyme
MTRFSVRPSTVEDQEAIAAIRVAAWRSSYRGIVPAGFLDAMDPVAQGARRLARFGTRPETDYEYVAGTRGGVVGFVHGGRYRDEDDPTDGSGEVFALYVLPDTQGTGAGGALLGAAVEHLHERQVTPVLLWVLRDNTASRRFYERCGFVADGAEHDFEVDGVRLPEVRYRLD